MRKIIFAVTTLFILNGFSQEKKLWAKSIINKKAPKLVVEKWLSEKPETKGKFILIDFWATWCGPCKIAISELNHFKTEFESDLIVIGISDETKEEVNKLTTPKIEYSSAIDTRRTMYDTLEIQGIPHCILIDPDGIVRWEGYPILNGYELTSDVIKNIIEKYKTEKIQKTANK
jgi:thiol-disulfide isomerase/thioredoxin